MTAYKIHYPSDYYGQWEEECAYKGRLAGVMVEFPEGGMLELNFVDIARLHQSLEDQEAVGHSFYSEPGLVVLSSVTRENIEAAVRELFREGFGRPRL